MALRRIPVLVTLVLLGIGVDMAVGALPATSPWQVNLTFLLGLLLLVSYVTGALAADLGLPRITGYILAGLLLGPSGVGVVTTTDIESLALIDQLAIALIAFSAGAELKIRQVREGGKVIGAILVCEMTLVFVAVAGLVLLLRPVFPLTAGRGWSEAVIIAAVFGSVAIANSPSVAVAVTNDTRSRGPLSSTILGVTVLKDVAVIILFAITLSLARAVLDGGSAGGGLGMELLTRMWWEIGGSILAGALLGWLVSQYLGRLQGQPILFVLGIAALVTIIAAHLHLEILLTALTTGFFVENIAQTEAEPFVKAVEVNALPLYALFFSLAGASIHLTELLEVGGLVFLLVAVRAGSIWLGTHLGARLGGASERVRRYSWTGFVSQAGVTLGMVTIAAQAFPEWGAEMKTLFVAMVALHELVGPVLLQHGLSAAGETGARDRDTDSAGPEGLAPASAH